MKRLTGDIIMDFQKQDEDLSPAEIRELKSRIDDLHNPVRYVIYSDLLPNGRWRLFLNASDDTFCDQLETATLFKREHVAQAVVRACSERRHRDLLVAKITTRNDKRRVLKYALPGPRTTRKKRPTVRDLMKDSIGKINSGIPDLASNPKHLEGLGGDSRGNR
jgi:hypothetical protein